MQQRVVTHGGAQHAGVVTKFADLGRGFVHERQRITRDTNRAGGEQRVGLASGKELHDGRVVEIKTVPRDEQVDTRRVTATHFEPVER